MEHEEVALGTDGETRWYRRIGDGDVEIASLTGHQFLEIYWGSSWPAMEAHLREALTEDVYRNQLRVWKNHGAETVGDIDEFIENLGDLLWKNHTQQNARGEGAVRIVSRIAHLESPYDHNYDVHALVEDAVRQSLDRRSAVQGIPWTAAEKFELCEQIAEREGPAIIDALRELDQLGAELLQQINRCVKDDLDSITTETPPRLGALSIGPIMLTSPIGYTNPGTPRIHLVTNAAGLPSMDPDWPMWSAMYYLHIDQIPGLDSYITNCEAARERITSWLEAVVSTATGE